MKVIVAKKNHPRYIGLSNTGQFVKFRHRTQLKIGEQADIKPSTFNIEPRSIIGIAASLLIISTSIFGYAYSIPNNYLYVDINPSIELAINCFDRVISAKGLNADGEEVVSETSLNYSSTEASVEKIIEKAIQKGYMREGLENIVLLNSSGDDKVINKIKEKINIFAKSGNLANINPEIQIDSINRELLQEAQKQHVSAGKLKLIDKATDENPELSKEQLSNMTVREIVREIKTSKIKGKSKDFNNKTNGQTPSTSKEIDNIKKPDVKFVPILKSDNNNKKKPISKAEDTLNDSESITTNAKVPDVPSLKPKETPRAQPKETPRIEPKETPRTQPKETPRVEPKETPRVEPKETPRIEPKETPRVEPKETPRIEPKETPRVEPKETPRIEPKETPRIEPKETPRVEPKVPPHIETEIPPRIEPKETPRIGLQVPIQTN